MFRIERIEPPYPSVDVTVQPEQTQFTSPVSTAIEKMQFSEIAFVIRDSGKDVGFFTLIPSDSDVIYQLRSDFV